MTELGPLTSPDVAACPAAGPAVLLLPLGSTEQHGPHLPLDTDVRIAVEVARAVAGRLHGTMPVLVAPALAYGSSGEHQGFPGTLSMGAEALELVVVELARSVGPEFGHVLLVNGHGGNVEALDRAVGRLQGEGRAVSSWSPHLPHADPHAGRTETSLLLALAPQLVRMERATAGDRRPLEEVWPLLRSGGVAAVSANGVLGDPAGADPKEGASLFEQLVTQLETAVREAVKKPGETPVSPAPEDG